MVSAVDLLAAPLEELLVEARRLRSGPLVTYSPKVFIPLTTLCRDVCGYCTFARPPRRGERAFMTDEEVLAIARAGAAAGCREALFTLGDKPELRYKVAREELRALGCETTLEYLERCARLVLDETGLLPHLNPGVMTRAELEALRPVSASMGIMLETTAERLGAKGGPHWASPDKFPLAASRRSASRASCDPVHERDPHRDRRDAGGADRRAPRAEGARRGARARAGGHRPELPREARDADGRAPGAVARRAPLDDRRRADPARRRTGTCRRRRTSPSTTSRACSTPASTTGAASRRSRSITSTRRRRGRSSSGSREATRSRGLELAPRLPVYPEFVAGRPLGRSGGAAGRSPRIRRDRARARRRLGAGRAGRVPFVVRRDALPLDSPERSSARTRSRASSRRAARRQQRVFAAADALRREVCGDDVTYVVTRNIQYTNVCYFRCGFCAFSKGKLAANLRGAPYLVPLDEIVRRAQEAWERGATEVCLQGGIHPAFTGDYYATSCARSRRRFPGSTCTRSRRSRCGRARRRSACRSSSIWSICATSGSARFPEPLRRCSTTRCDASSARTR